MTEAAPNEELIREGDGDGRWYRVCLNTIVRKSVELDSERLRILPMGSRVRVVARKGRRVQISQPIEGWCSMQSSNGDTILQVIENSNNQQPITTPKVAEVAKNLRAGEMELKQKLGATEDPEEKKKLAKELQDAQNQLLQAEKQIMNYKQQMEELVKKDAASSSADAKSASDVSALRRGDVVQIPIVGIAIVRYYGPIDGQDGMFVGVELDNPIELEDGTTIGDTNGTIDGKQYFSVPDNHGKFFPQSDIKMIVSAENLLRKLETSVNKIAQLEQIVDQMAKGEAQQ